MNKLALLTAIVGTAFCLCTSNVYVASASEASPPAEAERLMRTPEGAAYGKAFAAAIAQRFVQARDECIVKLKLQPPQQIDVTFIVSAKGQITGTLAAANQPISAYIAKKLMGFKVPKPPHDEYPVRARGHSAAR